MKKLLILPIIILSMSGCATIFTGTHDTISFNSNPQGAMVYKDGVELCRTPCQMPVKRSVNNTDIAMRLDGYQTRLFTLDKELNVVSILNLANIFGWAIDGVSGAVFRYDRKFYDIQLDKDKMALLENPVKLNINSVKKTVDVYVSGE